MPYRAFTGTLQILEEQSGRGNVRFGELLHALKQRGFGPLLMVPSLLAVLPTGAIPGIPALCGIFICLVSGQMVLGRKLPWFPKILMNWKMKAASVRYATHSVKPYACKMDDYARPRLAFFTQPFFQRLIAVLCFVLGFAMIFMGFIPLLPALLSLPVLFYAWGISVKDGALILSGMIVTTTCAAFIVIWAFIPDEFNLFPEIIPTHAEIVSLIKSKLPS